MYRLLSCLFVAVLCAGCATNVVTPNQADGSAGHTRTLAFQRASLEPKTGGQLIRAALLKPGDILLSAARSITSAGVRLLTLAPVSHASIYMGEDNVAEAVGAGVRVRKMHEVLDEESVVVAFRHPGMNDDHGARITEFAQAQVGRKYNHMGIVLQAPFSIERRVCEVPLVPEAIRDACVRGIAVVQLGASKNDRFFCSQLVLEAYRQAGLPMTDADPRLISPADILHMREGDVPSVKTHQALVYLGHLKVLESAATPAQELLPTQ